MDRYRDFGGNAGFESELFYLLVIRLGGWWGGGGSGKILFKGTTFS